MIQGIAFATRGCTLYLLPRLTRKNGIEYIIRFLGLPRKEITLQLVCQIKITTIFPKSQYVIQYGILSVFFFLNLYSLFYFSALSYFLLIDDQSGRGIFWGYLRTAI